MTEKKKVMPVVEYKFENNYSRFEINVSQEKELPILVLKKPTFEDGELIERGILYCGDYIIDDLIRAYPTLKETWFLVSTTQSHVIPQNESPDLHLYTTSDGEESPEYLEGRAKDIPSLILGCGHFVDTEVFYPKEQEKEYDLIYVSKWAPTKRIEKILEAAALDKSLKILIVGFPVVSERKKAQSDIYREYILKMKEEMQLDNVTIIEPDVENHVNEDGSLVVGGFSKEEMNDFYNRARMTILAADSHEAINRALVEAMCCDLPIILTNDTLGGAQTLVNFQTGIKVNATPEDIVAGINHIKETIEHFSPRDWYASKYGKENSNRVLRIMIEEISKLQGYPVSAEGMKPYGGDVWSKTDFYEHVLGTV